MSSSQGDGRLDDTRSEMEEKLYELALAARAKSPDPSVPEICWARRLDEPPPPSSVHGPARPGLLEALSLLPVAFRVGRYLWNERSVGRDPIFDLTGILMKPPDPGPYAGVPLGGIGGGSIGRGFRGDFRRWMLRPGRTVQRCISADQFSVSVRSASTGRVLGSTVLSSLTQDEVAEDLRCWGWHLSPSCATYCALYPRAWHVYDSPVPGVRLCCRQVSPVWAHNYRETSLPTCAFIWTLENVADEPLSISLMFTFENDVGLRSSRGERCQHKKFELDLGDGSFCCGVELRSEERRPAVFSVNDEGALPPTSHSSSSCDSFSFAMAAGPGATSVSVCESFASAEELWGAFADGRPLPPPCSPQTLPNPPRAAVCQTITLEQGESRELTFSLAWDSPYARFGSGKALPRRYTRYFGRTANAAPAMAAHALTSYNRWESAIEAWQGPVLEDAHVGRAYKYTLFNELYFITEGGTLWLDSVDGIENGKLEGSQALLLSRQEEELDRACDGLPERIGQFLYLEGHEYLMYNTYDVHFYSSFALAMQWPMLELSLQRDVAASVPRVDNHVRPLLGEWGYMRRKVGGVVPHDLGSPSEEPWSKVNSYTFQDVSRWKDLGPKFVLQVYRDFCASGSLPFLREMWPAMVQVMLGAMQWDEDGDGLIENQGFPDQTYDIWTATGPSAYTGGLWVAALSAMGTAGQCLSVPEPHNSAYWKAEYERSREAYHSLLWNGRYFNYDGSASRHSDSIMADQMAGQWYCRACGLDPVASGSQARSALSMVYEHNVLRFAAGGRVMGAVNGMRPDGRVDNTCLQSREVWTGVSYACAAAMLHEAAVALEGLPNSASMRNISLYAGGKKALESSPDISREELRDHGHRLRHAAFEIVRGVHDCGWNDWGYFFQMPEAWEHNGNYRSLGYMRSLAIWAIQWAIEHEELVSSNALPHLLP